ncbi:bifunctional ATP-dependent DNA helicase/ssDNA endodeoxyribonuclease DNA2 [Aspergillus chevalieri]|uniref:DNA replication ATP-dependent helicase/nuclease n=1 Tax=Aspergillus chevalieri TaxID=182096 RepID=A0A7R7VEN4_ASPCH|nr:tripartite DNA replication factor [Aspergillus chevalieri]BCR82867.1 tripartite DNA replication factor [Aspergillus chevalieri]
MSKPLNSYPISSKSRTKLHAFRYDDDAEKSTEKSPAKSSSKSNHATKENQASWLNGVVEQEEPRPGKEPLSSQTTETKQIKECPQTPMNRLPLADLIGNAEDAISRAPGQELTPEDHVIWQHVPTSSNSGSVSRSARGKKRRHSATPSSSPLADNSNYANQEPLDMQSAQALLKTPQNDLATDLWNNYVGKGVLNGNGDLPPPRLQNLLSSSPQTPASAKKGRDSSGLRRAISCNVDWPTSKAKRRRMDGDGSRTGRNIFSRSRSNVVDSGNAKTTSLRSLVEKMESLHKAPAAPADPPGSSSVPVRANVQQRNRSIPPIEDKTALKVSGMAGSKDTTNTLGPNSRELQETTPQGSSSEFEDDDLDMDLLEFADTTLDSFTEPTQSRSTVHSVKPVPTNRPVSKEQHMYDHSMEAMPHSTNVGMNIRNAANDIDEFDDDDDELPENIRMVLDGCDKAPVAAKPESSPTPKHAVSTNSSKEIEKPDSSSGDEFDDEDFDFEAIEQSMRHPGDNGRSHNIRSRQAIKRYLIADTAEDTYTTPKGRAQPEQILLVQDEKSKLRKVIILRESWFDSPCSKDSYIHLIGEFDAQGHCIVDDSQNMIILHPDHLISATVVSDSTSCQRRAVLQERIKYSGDIGKAQVFGNVFHEIFQEAMKKNRWDLSSLKSLATNVLSKHVEDLYIIQMTMAQAVEYVMGRIPALRSWAETFLRVKPTNESVVEDRNSSKMRLSINKLLEVEEHIWSPMYGLKGNVDATVQIACNDGEGDKNLVIPLELKTGNRDTNHAHRAQTALYTLLLSDRYDVDVNFGLLYYLEISKIFRIRGIRHELLQMIQERNRLAGYVRQRLQLPPMVKRPGMCNKCYAKTPCLIYHKLADDGNGDSSGLGDDFDKDTDHLTPQHQAFFKKWDQLLTKEEQDMMKFRRELWTLLSTEREALGRCFGNVVIEPGSSSDDNDNVKINRYRYTFIKKQASPSFSFTESQLTLGEPIVVSDEKGHFALANGYVVQVSPKRITVAVDRRLHNARTKTPGFDSKWNQSFKGVMEILDNGASATTAQADDSEEEMVYRLDKDEFSNGMAIVRNNIVAMMERDLFQAKQLRRLIVDNEPPVFKPTSSHKMSEAGMSNLNIDQKRAIDKVMSAKDYALVLGMPGTGKTTTIAHIIRALVSQGKSVLLTSYTHTAVDNILLKIRGENVRILRIGATAKVHPEVQQFVDLAATPRNSVEEVQARYENPQIVATTCLGVNHSIFSRRIFDYCIVDEASQITLPVCLGPIRMARTFILVGDHFQLPPLVQNKEAQEGGLDVSLFKLLSAAHPDSVVNLEHQYRMAEDIMLLSNNLIYSGHLKCGTPEVASRSLEIPNIAGLEQHHIDQFPQTPTMRQRCLGTSQGRCWLRDLVDPSVKTRFVNTDTLVTTALEVAVGSRIVNTTESTLCAQLVEAFISCGISARNIGVITFYRSQLSVLKQDLRHYLPELEMHTADKFQGRDKEVVILSCVRSNAENYVGDLLSDWRRVNVAFTRARTKLLVVGSKNTLRDGNELLGKYMNLVENRGWVYDLPEGAIENHVFQHDSLSATQTQPPRASQSKPSFTPKKRPSQTKAARNPLSPVQDGQGPNGAKQPAKKGAKILNGNRVIGNRPILQDVVNDFVG